MKGLRLLAFASVLGCGSVGSAADPQIRVGGHTYVYVQGKLTQQEAYAEAARRGGYAVVFETLDEHAKVIAGFGMVVAHTGHFQLSNGREPGMGWVTVNGKKSAPLGKLFNSDGPDDGIRNKWGWAVSDGGLEVFYGPSNGKNEDAGVTWYNNGGKLEDVSINHRAGVIIEFNR
jgi:hypothetical protein